MQIRCAIGMLSIRGTARSGQTPLAKSHPLWTKTLRGTTPGLKTFQAPAGVKPISPKWVFKTKPLPEGGIRYKARLVIRGFEQLAGVDFGETFAPVVKLQSLRMMLALAASHNWEIDKMDVSPFPKPVDENVYMAMPEGIEAGRNGPRVCKLKKSLYVKQAPRLLHKHIDEFFRFHGLRRCEHDPNVYISASRVLADRTEPAVTSHLAN